MIQFTCPGCKAAHTANPAFANRRAKCVRCGANMYIPVADGEATFAPYGNLPNSGGTLPSGPVSSAAARQSPAEEEPAAPPRFRRKQVVAVAMILLLLIVGVVVYFVFFNKPTEPTKKKPAPPPVVEEKEESKPPPKPEPYEFVGPIQPPPPPPVPVVVNADRLQVEIAALAARGGEGRYRGRYVEVRGICKDEPRVGASRLTFYVPHHPGGIDQGSIVVTLPHHFPPFPEGEESAAAVLGGLARPTLDGNGVEVRKGRPVCVRGWYTFDGKVERAEVVSTLAPADPTYLGKKVSITAVISFDQELPGVRFDMPGRTDAVVGVECRFTQAASRAAQQLFVKPTLATVTGTCTGRTLTTVRLENCAVGDGGEVTVTPEKLIADYEADLVPVPPIEPAKPVVKLTAAELALAYKQDAKAADAKFSDCIVELTGFVLKRNATANTLQFETATDTAGVLVEAVLPKAEFAALPADETTLTVRGEFRGTLFTRSPNHLRVENAYGFDPDSLDPKVKKLSADFLPVRAGRRWEVVRAVFPEPPPPKPADPKRPVPPPKPVPASVQRIAYQSLPDGAVLGVQTQTGTLAADALGDAEPKWAGKPLKPTAAPAVERFWVRANDRLVEIGAPKSDAKPGADGKEELVWQPLLRVNAKLGREWDSEPAAGQTVRTRVAEFFTDPAGRECAKVVVTFTDAKQADARLETTVVYAKGVGEVWRSVRAFDKEHKGGRVVMEQKLVREVLGSEVAAAAVLGGWAAVPQPERRAVDRAATAAVGGALTAVPQWKEEPK